MLLSTIATTDDHTGGALNDVEQAVHRTDPRTCARLAVLAADGHMGEHVFSIDPCDPLVPGFVLR